MDIFWRMVLSEVPMRRISVRAVTKTGASQLIYAKIKWDRARNENSRASYLIFERGQGAGGIRHWLNGTG